MFVIDENTKRTKTDEIIPNENICFPIGTILAVKKQI